MGIDQNHSIIATGESTSISCLTSFGGFLSYLVEIFQVLLDVGVELGDIVLICAMAATVNSDHGGPWFLKWLLIDYGNYGTW